MKIEIKTEKGMIKSCDVTTENGAVIENITNISFDAGLDCIPRATIEVNSMDDVTFELLDKNTDVYIHSDDLIKFPTYKIIEHLRNMGYEVAPKGEK
jgi:hypothetical protein